MGQFQRFSPLDGPIPGPWTIWTVLAAKDCRLTRLTESCVYVFSTEYQQFKKKNTNLSVDVGFTKILAARANEPANMARSLSMGTNLQSCKSHAQFTCRDA